MELFTHTAVTVFSLVVAFSFFFATIINTVFTDEVMQFAGGQ